MDDAIVGSGVGLVLDGDVSSSGRVSDAKLFYNVDIGNRPGVVTLEDMVMLEFATTTFEVARPTPASSTG